MNERTLNQLLGNLDLFILDHILKGRFSPEMRILDAGCGEGRNLNYFFHHNYSIYGIDKNPAAIRMVRFLIRSAYPAINPEQFSCGAIESMPFKNEHFDAIICSAVLHFAQDHQHFIAMFSELHRCLRPNGQLLITCGYRLSGTSGAKDSEFSYQLDNETIKQLEQIFKLRKVGPAKTVVWENGPTLIELIMEKL